MMTPTDIVTADVRLIYPSLFEATPKFMGSDDMRYQATFLIPEDADLSPYQSAIDAALAAKFSGKVPKLADHPVRSADEKAAGLALHFRQELRREDSAPRGRPAAQRDHRHVDGLRWLLGPRSHPRIRVGLLWQEGRELRFESRAASARWRSDRRRVFTRKRRRVWRFGFRVGV